MARLVLSPGEISEIFEKLESIEKQLKNKAPQQDDPILTTEQVMNYLSVSRRSLQNWRDNGLIEYSAVNGKFYYRVSAINKMLDRHLQKNGDVNYGTF
jgi:hypothetical protein